MKRAENILCLVLMILMVAWFLAIRQGTDCPGCKGRLLKSDKLMKGDENERS